MKLILFLLFFTSCAWHPLQESLAQKEAKRFQAEFLKAAQNYNLALKPAVIKFVEIEEINFPAPEPIAGACLKGEVLIDQRWWKHSPVAAKEQLIFHELGHCLLKLPHGQGIMGIKEMPSDFYLTHKHKLLEQMFKSVKKK